MLDNFCKYLQAEWKSLNDKFSRIDRMQSLLEIIKHKNDDHFDEAEI